MIFKKLYAIVMIAMISTQVYAQDRDATNIIAATNKKFKLVKDYIADVNIKTDIYFVNILPINAKILFKQPGKFKMKSKGIMILPKQGPDLVMKSLQEQKNYTAIYAGDKMIGNVNTAIIKMLPIQDTCDLVLGTFYIGLADNCVHKAQLTTRSSGTIQVDIDYANFNGFELPQTVMFKVDVNKFKIPKALTVDLENTKKKKSKNEKVGTVTLKYSNYLVNKGIDDKEFN